MQKICTNRLKGGYELKMLHLYTDVSPCPKCKSKKTGYYIQDICQRPSSILFHLRKGEYVDFKPDTNTTNCFCVDCHTEWYSPLSASFVNQKQIKLQQEQREITPEYMSETKSVYLIKRKEEEKRVKESKNNHIKYILQRVIANIKKILFLDFH